MLGATAPRPFDSPDFLFEVKWDGYRAVAFLGGGRTRLQSRNLRDLTPHYPTLSGLHLLYPDRRLVLDGEVVAFSRGKPDFGRLQRGEGPFTYVAFDLLYVDGESFLRRPLTERRGALAALLGEAGAAPRGAGEGGAPSLAQGPLPVPILLSEAFPVNGVSLFQAAKRLDLEGIMAKRATSPYRPGVRSEDWLKVKNTKTMECVIAGYTRGDGFAHVGSLVLGAHQTPPQATPNEAAQKGNAGDYGLVYVGNAGTGFTGEEVTRILGLMHPLAPGSPCPLPNVPAALRREAVWVQPELVCEIEFTELTADRRLRHPTYRGLRWDKSPGECVLP